MDPLLAQPEFVEALCACLYSELALRVLRKDSERAGREPGHQRAVLLHMDIPWHRRSAAVQKEWLEAVKAALDQLIGPGPWYKGIPASRVEGPGAPPILENDSL